MKPLAVTILLVLASFLIFSAVRLIVLATPCKQAGLDAETRNGKVVCVDRRARK